MDSRTTVLVVDDDSQILRTVGGILRFKGYDPVSAPTGREGIAAAEEHEAPPAIALVDLRLPDMDGFELVTKLREISPFVEVLILTGNASLDTALRALREQSYDYLLKPVAPDRLLDSVSRASDRWQRRMAEAALEDRELRLRRMFECVGDAVFITDDRQTIIDANPAAILLAGRALDTMQGQPIDAILGLSPRHLDIRSNPFAPGLNVHMVRDLSEKMRLEAALHHSQKMDAIGRLAGGVAHDFNNLLAVISGFTSLLLSRCPPESPDREVLTEIAGAAQRGAALTRQLLGFSRKQELAPRVMSANDTVRGIEQILRRLCGDEIEMRLVLEDDIDALFADPGQFEQVVANLVVNARDATAAGGSVTIRTLNTIEQRAGQDPKPYVRIDVTDTGVGIPPEIVDRIFEPFFTTKPEGKGTGIGLATVHSIVEQSGGFLRVDSRVGRGTTFSILLPSYRPDLHVAR